MYGDVLESSMARRDDADDTLVTMVVWTQKVTCVHKSFLNDEEE